METLPTVLKFAAMLLVVVLVLLWRKKTSVAEAGYCLSRTRGRLITAIWSLLVLFIALCMGAVFLMGLQQDTAYWDKWDYITLYGSALIGAALLALGLYMLYTGVRDAFFPEKSALARSIRGQLSAEEVSLPVAELFALVDDDLAANGLWFDTVCIGEEWVLGDLANRIDRLRGIFAVDKIHQRHINNRVQTQRILELILIDADWQKTVTTFKSPSELRAAADYLALRVPEARRGQNDQYIDFWNMNYYDQEEFEREFQQKRSNRAERH